MALPDHFEGEDVIITFEKEYDSTYDSTTRTLAVQNIEGKVLSWNIGGGNQPSEDVFAFGGKTFNFQKPREKFTLAFDVMINNSDFDFVQFGSTSTKAGNPRIGSMTGSLVRSTDTNKRFRVIFWFQESQYHIANSGRTVVVPTKTQSCYRMIFCDVKSVTFDKEFAADEYFKGTINLEFSSSDSDGNANFYEEEGLYTGTTSTKTSQLSLLTTATGTTTCEGIMREAKGYLDYTATTTPAWYAGSTTTDTSDRYRYTG